MNTQPRDSMNWDSLDTVKFADEDESVVHLAERTGLNADAQARIQTAAGKSENWLVNASTLGLMMTGGIIEVDPEARKNPSLYLRKMTQKLGEPVIRAAVMQAMRIMGEQFVLGRTIKEALKRGRKAGNSLCSFDMLGEGARSAADAARYQQRYLDAIAVVGAARGKGPIEQVHGVSVKISALHPRFAHGLAKLDLAAGDGPLAGIGRLAAPDQQHLFIAPDDNAGTGDGVSGLSHTCRAASRCRADCRLDR